MPDRICSVVGCSKPLKCRGYCSAHYFRYWRNGDVGGAELQPRGLVDQICSLSECGRPVYAKRMCEKHWRRNRLHGDPEYVQPRTGEHNNCYRADNIGIGAAHDRVISRHGPALQHQCTHCGGQAKHWAYDHTDPDEKDGGKAGPYSVDPAHYQPMCVPCHKRFDLAYLASAPA